MAENDDVPGSPDANVQPADEPNAVPAAEAPVLKTRWRDRAWSFRAMIAVALASVLIGGVGGSALVAATGDDDNDGHYRMGPYGPGGMMPPGTGRRMPKHFGNDGNGYWQWQPGQPNNPNPDAPTPVPPTPGSTS